MSRVDVDGATRWMSVGGELVDVSRLEDVRSALDDGPSDLPALSAWAYRTGLSIPEVASKDPRDAAERVCAWIGVPAASLEFMSRACYGLAIVGTRTWRYIMRWFFLALGRITLAVLRGLLRVLLWAVRLALRAVF